MPPSVRSALRLFKKSLYRCKMFVETSANLRCLIIRINQAFIRAHKKRDSAKVIYFFLENNVA